MTTKRIIILVILLVTPVSVTYAQTGCDPTWIHSYYVRGKEKVEDLEYSDNVFWCGRTTPVAGPLVLPYQHVARNICVREWQFLPETIKGITCLNFDFKATVNSALQDITNELHDCVCPTTGGLTISKSCENLNGAEPIEIFGTTFAQAFDKPGIDGREVPGQMEGRNPSTDVPSVWLNLSQDRKRNNEWCWQPECNNPSI
ncbi:MAG: hypothetical protein M5R41_15270 [Bacteroidia bacterium]|nr:hypothetical protein [Bacteroidia bacterium]